MTWTAKQKEASSISVATNPRNKNEIEPEAGHRIKMFFLCIYNIVTLFPLKNLP